MISVLLPVYNGEKFIHYAIQSILNQTYKDFELLIIDDGSTDNTKMIITSFSDKRIKYVRKSNTGLADTLNFGLKIAKYDWVARMDADDIAHPRRLEKQVKYIENDKGNTIIATWSAYFDSKGVIRFMIETPIDDKILKKKLALHCYINHPTVLYNRNFILNNGGYNPALRIHQDYELWLRLREKVIFKIIPEYLVFVFERKGSLSRSSDSKRIILEYLNKYYPLEKNKNIFKKKEINRILGWREYFYGEKSESRKYWLKSFLLLLEPRILLAFFITFLPSQYIDEFKQSNFKLRLRYLIKHLSRDNNRIEKEFKRTLIKMETK